MVNKNYQKPINTIIHKCSEIAVDSLPVESVVEITHFLSIFSIIKIIYVYVVDKCLV